MSTLRFFLVVTLLLAGGGLQAQSITPGKNVVYLRGTAQSLYFYPAASGHTTPAAKVLFAPGDGGWRGFALTIAEHMAAAGYDVYALDTKQYLESFTTFGNHLSEVEVMSDFRALGERIGVPPGGGIILAGWSEGAGLCLLAASAGSNKALFSGLVAIGMNDENVLAWRWSDYVTYLTKKPAREPSFASINFLPKVAPLPLVMIQCAGDEYVSETVGRRMFAAAQEPKRFFLLAGQNHKFEGNTAEFFRVLAEGLAWIGSSH